MGNCFSEPNKQGNNKNKGSRNKDRRRSQQKRGPTFKEQQQIERYTPATPQHQQFRNVSLKEKSAHRQQERPKSFTGSTSSSRHKRKTKEGRSGSLDNGLETQGEGSNENSSLKQSGQGEPSRGPNVAPTYSGITEDLGNLLQSKNTSHFPLFYIEGLQYSPKNGDFWRWTDPTFVRLPISHNFCNWDNLCGHLKQLKEACVSGQLKHQPENLGKYMLSMISNFQSNAHTESDFGVLSRPVLSKHVCRVIPIIVDLALRLPELLSDPIPYLQQDSSMTLHFTKELCSSLLAHCFLCTIPERGAMNNIRDVNFFRLFATSTTETKSSMKTEKVMCLLNYFVHVVKSPRQHNIVSFERRCNKDQVDWGKSSTKLTQIQIDSKGKIEEKEGMLQVDFANKNVGGGVLADGSVMEEIRFCISPEMILSRLFTQTLNNDEVLVMTGTEQFSKYSGYGSSFKYVGPECQSNLGEDTLGRLKTEVVALDAYSFKKEETEKQYKKRYLDRELHKCFVGFSGEDCSTPVATGNWGCGAFNGDHEFKFFIQIMAASEVGRPAVYYHTVGDESQGKRIEAIMETLRNHRVTVGGLYKILKGFFGEHYHCDSVFDFVAHELKAGEGGRKAMAGVRRKTKK